MNKRKLLTIIIFILIFVIGGVLYFLFSGGEETISPGTTPDDPFGSGNIGDRPINQVDEDEQIGEETISPEDNVGSMPAYRQLSTIPVAGFGWFQGSVIYQDQDEDVSTSTATSTIVYQPDYGNIVRYIDQLRGHVYETYTNSLGRVRLSNTTIPGVREASVLEDGNTLLLRYLENNEIKTFLGTLEERTELEEDKEEQTPYITSGIFLSDNILSFNTSIDYEEIFFINQQGEEGQGVVLDPESDSQTVVFNSKITEWIPKWSEENTVLLQTKASALTKGYSYELNTTNGVLERVVGGREGLVTLPQEGGNSVLFSSYTQNEPLDLQLYNKNTGEIEDVALSTLAEKCVWSTQDTNVFYCAAPSSLPSGIYPDDWYKGLVTFNDLFWRIDTSTGQTQLLLAPSDFDQPPVDAINLRLSGDGDFLYFIDKKTGTLWSIDLPN